MDKLARLASLRPGPRAVKTRARTFGQPATVSFEFQLDSVLDVVPWKRDVDSTMHWYGLTQGHYWIAIGEQEVFRIAPVDKPAEELPYVSYFVGKVWADLMDALPAILTPVPQEIAARLGSRPFARIDRMIAWANDNDLDDELMQLDPWTARELDTSHLIMAPRVCFWRVGDVMNIGWRSHPDAGELWTPVEGIAQLSVDEFLYAIRAFDRALMTAMRERVDELARVGGMANVDLDLSALEQEQIQRERTLERKLDDVRDYKESWKAMRSLFVVEDLSN